MNARRWPSRPGRDYPPGEYLQGRDGLGQAAQPPGQIGTASARRWPPPGPGAKLPQPGPYESGFADLHKAIGDLTESIGKIAPLVIGNRLVALDANGQGADAFRTPYQALAIASASASTLTVAAAPLQGNAPGPGPGVTFIKPRGFRVFNARAYAFSIYGGTPGDLVYVEAFAVPQIPNDEPGPLTGTALGALSLASDYPLGAVPVTASSGNQANANAVATLPGVAGKTTYITGFEMTAAGATGALVVVATVAGVTGGTKSYIFTFPAGATVAATPLAVEFPKPIPASAPNTAITVTLPAGGAGNTNAAATAEGYQL